MRRKRRPKKPNTAALNPTVAAIFGEARRTLREWVEHCEPSKRRFKDLAGGVDAGLTVMERLSRGEITVEQSLLEFDKLSASLPLLRLNLLPAWLPPTFAWELLKLVRAAQEKRPQAPQELREWLRRTFAKPRGRPTDTRLAPLYQAAAHLRKRRWTWMRITRKLCPSRSTEGHRCTKPCLDKMRMGVREYET